MATAIGVLNRFSYPRRNQPLTEDQTWFFAGVLLACLAAAYWLAHYGLPGSMSPDLQVYVVRPLVWGGIGLFAYDLWRRLPDRQDASRAFVYLALLAAAFQVAVLLSAGVLFGFGYSPYARDALHMAENLWYVGTFIFGLEMSRAYLLAVWGRKNAGLAFLATALLIGAIAIAPALFRDLTVRDQALQTGGRTVLPGFSESIMATFLASVGGPLPAFAYHLSLEAFRWLSPILPRLEWQVAAFIGTVAPMVAMLIVRDAYFTSQHAETDEEKEAQDAQRGVSPLLLLAGTVFVAMIWFQTGMLGVQPFLVSGPSMKPNLVPGDIVVVKEVDTDELQVGDVVRFTYGGGVYIIHRIVEIEGRGSGRVFVTRGDNNNHNDDPITASQITGRMVMEVPYVGWVPIKLKELLQ